MSALLLHTRSNFEKMEPMVLEVSLRAYVNDATPSRNNDKH